jgi:hypothetical protein
MQQPREILSKKKQLEDGTHALLHICECKKRIGDLKIRFS